MNKNKLYSEIESMCQELDYKLGWSLLYGRFENLYTPKYPIAFFGLNPAGSDYIKSNISNEDGSSYLLEEWDVPEAGGAPLQKQVQELFKTIASTINTDIDYKDLLNGSMAANFVPFRSGNWASLDKKKEALDFSRALWKEWVNDVECSLYITMSKVTFDEISNLLKEAGYIQVAKPKSDLVGWGKVTYQVSEYIRNDSKVALIRLPHLSRYKIFNRDESMSAINDIASISAKYLVLSK